jgi:hypothetical protein
MLAYHHDYLISLGDFNGEKQFVTNFEMNTLVKELVFSSKEAIYL